jgi:hypothetical protein
MWLYIIGGIIVFIVVVAYFFIRRGLNRIKPDPLKGSSASGVLIVISMQSKTEVSNPYDP